MAWLAQLLPLIYSYAHPAKTLSELQQDAQNPQPGYQIHHIVEQTPARQDGFSEVQIDGPDNLVRIPTLKHWQINGWYGRPNAQFKDKNDNDMSPRDYLRGKSWEERLRVGKEALILFGVLEP